MTLGALGWEKTAADGAWDRLDELESIYTTLYTNRRFRGLR